MLGAIIKGKVVDTHNEPVMFANVILLNDSVFIKGTTSDETGSFSIENSTKANVLKISIIGHKDYMCPLRDFEDMGTIILQDSYITLNEVVVKANLPQTQLKGNEMVTTVQNTVLAKMGSAYDVLSHIPMVTGINGELNVFGRGTPVVYINGREVRNQSDLQQLKSDEIRSVELISNPGAAYASNIAAVIKIKTIPPKGEGFGIDITDALGFWAYARNNTDVNMRYRHNGFEVFGNFNIYEGKRKLKDISEMTTFGSDNFIQSIYNEGSGTTHNLFGKLGFSYMIAPNHSIGAYYRFGRSNTEGDGYLDTKSIVAGNQNTSPLDHTIASYDNMTKNYTS